MALSGWTPKVSSWLYAAGVIRSVELRLMGRSGLERLFAAQNEADIERLLQEHGYPAGKAEEAMEKETAALFTLLEEISPDRRFLDTLLSFREAHNLKAMVKYLGAEQGAGESAGYNGVAPLLLTPALTDPAVLYKAVSERKWELLSPFWADTAKAALDIFATTYDTSRIDLVVDLAVQQEAQKTAASTKDLWFQNYLAYLRDMANLETLLRARARNIGEVLLQRSLLPEGQLKTADLLEWYSLPPAALKNAVGKSAYAAFAPFVESYGKPGQASAFAAAVDGLVAAHLQKAKGVTSGPEIPLAYVLSRLYEMKNVRIALSGLRNGLPKERTGAMVRPPYLEWR